MRYVLDIKQCTLLGKGKEGAVYLTPEGFALKIFYKKKNAEKEVEILEKVQDSRFFPKVLFIANNMVLREYVEGITLKEYIEKNGLSEKLSREIIDLIEDFKRLKFTRINIRNAHIFVDKNENIKVIDPRKTYEKITPYPKDIIKILSDLNIFEDFLKHLLAYKDDLINYWISAYNFHIRKVFKIYMEAS